MSNTRFLLRDVRIAFPVLFKAEQFQGQGSFRCGASLIVPPNHPQLAEINAAIDAAAVNKWKDKAPAMLKAARGKDNVALHDGDSKPKYDGFPGNFYLSANCSGGATEAEAKKPKVFDQAKNEITDPAKNPIYAGCRVNALIDFYADDRYGVGVHCSLLGVQFFRDADAFGAAPAKADDFDDVSEGISADDLA